MDNNLYPSDVYRGILSQIGQTFIDLAMNPATPEIIKEPYRQAYNTIQNSLSNLSRIDYDDVIEGRGPVATSLRNAVRWLGADFNYDPSRAAVFYKFYQEGHDTVNDPVKLRERLWSLFYHEFPVEMFKTSGELHPLTIGYSFHGMDFKIEVAIGDFDKDKEKARIEKIIVGYGPKQEYWHLTAILNRREVIFKEVCKPMFMSGTHFMENMTFSLTSHSFMKFFDEHLLELVAGLLNFELDSEKLGEVSTGNIANLNAVELVLEEAVRREFPNAAVHEMAMEHILRRVKHGYCISIDSHDISYVIKSDDSRWHSLADYEKDKDGYYVKRDNLSWFSVRDLKIAGVPQESKSLIPDSVMDVIMESIKGNISKLFDEMFEEWNRRPHGAWALYLKELSDGEGPADQ